jgi:hypothetical protein
MNYFILRNGQQYGPYSLANLQLYLSIGNVSLNDLGRTEAMNEWLPLSQIAGGVASAPPPVSSAGPTIAPSGFSAPAQSPASNGAPYGGYNAQPMAPVSSGPTCTGYPVPPNLNPVSDAPLPPGSLHWGVLLLLVVATLGLAGTVWAFVQANWVRKIDRESKAILFLVISVASSLLGQILNGAREYLIALPILVGCIVFMYVAVFSMRASIERYYNTVEPRGLKLSGVMTFFFGIFYFQYHLHRILQEKRSAPLTQGPPQYPYARPA